MEKRELFKVYELDGRQWRIGKFDAMTGSYIAYKLMGEMLPNGLKIEGIPMASSGTIMSKADFIDLQKDCLKVCAELLPAGPANVLNDNGSWGVDGIENNPKIALTLMIQTIIWNVADFFDASLLQSLATGLSDIMPPIAKT